MGMKPPINEPQSKICDYLSVPGPKETGPHLPEANLVSSSKDVDEKGFKGFAPNIVAITPAGAEAGYGGGGGYETKKPG